MAALVIDSSTEVVIGTAAVLAVPRGRCRSANDKGEHIHTEGKRETEGKGRDDLYLPCKYTQTHTNTHRHTQTNERTLFLAG